MILIFQQFFHIIKESKNQYLFVRLFPLVKNGHHSWTKGVGNCASMYVRAFQNRAASVWTSDHGARACACFTWGSAPLCLPCIPRPHGAASQCAPALFPALAAHAPLHSHTHARGLAAVSRWLRQMGPITTRATSDLRLQHSDEIFATYV